MVESPRWLTWSLPYLESWQEDRGAGSSKHVPYLGVVRVVYAVRTSDFSNDHPPRQDYLRTIMSGKYANLPDIVSSESRMERSVAEEICRIQHPTSTKPRTHFLHQART